MERDIVLFICEIGVIGAIVAIAAFALLFSMTKKLHVLECQLASISSSLAAQMNVFSQKLDFLSEDAQDLYVQNGRIYEKMEDATHYLGLLDQDLSSVEQKIFLLENKSVSIERPQATIAIQPKPIRQRVHRKLRQRRARSE